MKCVLMLQRVLCADGSHLVVFVFAFASGEEDVVELADFTACVFVAVVGDKLYVEGLFVFHEAEGVLKANHGAKVRRWAILRKDILVAGGIEYLCIMFRLGYALILFSPLLFSCSHNQDWFNGTFAKQDTLVHDMVLEWIKTYHDIYDTSAHLYLWHHKDNYYKGSFQHGYTGSAAWKGVGLKSALVEIQVRHDSVFLIFRKGENWPDSIPAEMNGLIGTTSLPVSYWKTIWSGEVKQ